MPLPNVHTTAVCLPLAAVLLCAAGTASAQAPSKASQPQIGITVDRDRLVQGEAFQLTINIATESAEDPAVKLPALGGLRVLRQSESHPMSFSFSFGMGTQTQRISQRQSVYDFVVVADRSGRYVIDPVVVEVDGRKYQSQPYSLEVAASGRQGPATDPTEPSQEPSAPPAQGEDVRIDASEVDPDYFVSMSLSKDRVVVGEAVVLTVHLYTTWNLSGYHLVREPGTDGFWAETMDTNGQRPNQQQVQVAGRSYERTELRKLALFPVKTGAITIAPAIAELEVRRGGFFSKRKNIKRVAAPVTLTVEQPPDEGRPDGFDPANVGRFSFRGEVDRAEVKVGEPITMTMTVRGAGNLRNLKLPMLEGLDGFKVYAPENEIELRATDGSVTGSLTSKILLIPKDPGQFTIPRLDWIYYDPQSSAYRTVHSDEVKITVRPGEGFAGGAIATGEEAPDDEGAIDRLNRKLRSITSRASLEVGSSEPALTRPWFLGLVIFAPLAYLGLLVFTRARRRMAEREAKGRSRKADSAALRQLAELDRAPGSLPSERFFAGLQKILTSFLETRLEAQVAGDTMAELSRRLVSRGFDEELATRTVMELEACDFARFAAGASSAEERGKAAGRVAALIRDLGMVRVTPPEEQPR